MIEIYSYHARQYTYNLYYTDTIAADLSHHCLYTSEEQVNGVGDVIANVEQIIEFCFRPTIKINDTVNEMGILSILTFNQMRKKSITQEDLISWSTPIDLIERYENYLQTNQTSPDDILYQCIEPWFGPFCQYSFDFNQTFMNIVKVQLYWKPINTQYSKHTCYVHLKCLHYLPLACLDWREICDGKLDCIDGEDEQNCFELEMNQCHANEYQCRNGMCIDQAFVSDDTLDLKSPECLDGSDESLIQQQIMYSQFLFFLSEDLTRRNSEQFSCGDGAYFTSLLPRTGFRCANKRDASFNYLINWNRANDTHFSDCFKIFICGTRALTSAEFNIYCKRFCQDRFICRNQTLQYCSSHIIAPNYPVWDGHVRLGYFTNRIHNTLPNLEPHFVCYDILRCPFFTPDFILENYTCIHIELLNISDYNFNVEFSLKFAQCHRPYQSANETHCLHSNMSHCLGTNKCIPNRRIMDGIQDCYSALDESKAMNSCTFNDKNRFQCTSENKCLSPMLINNLQNDCLHEEDESVLFERTMNIEKLPFSAICDNFTDMLSIFDNDTDETNCEEWPCVNQYSRCNGVWNCWKGEDELSCSPEFNCPPDHHPCLLPDKFEMDCLHISLAEDGIVHCLGATDEQSYCRRKYSDTCAFNRCWNETDCTTAPYICTTCTTFNNINQVCQQANEINEKAVKIINYVKLSFNEVPTVRQPFSHITTRSFPSEPIQIPKIDQDEEEEEEEEEEETEIYEPMDPRDIWICNKGILIRVGSDGKVGCLCPQSYYGDRCRYQNQRVSLTLRLRKENFQRLDIVGIVIRLVDNTGFVHSYEQITFIPTLDCNTKFNIHLLYQTRPKDMTKKYTINIDAFDKIHLTHLTNWTLSIPLIFLPVNRVSAQFTIPAQSNHSNYSVSYNYNYSSDSIFVGFANNNHPIYLCSLNKTGPRCFLKSICRNDTCKNGAICVPYNTRTSLKTFVCVCPEGYSGERCENKQVSITISFSDIKIPDSFLLHYITVPDDYLAKKITILPRSTLFKKIPYHENIVQMYMPFPFHLLYAQIADSYYLIYLQHNYISAMNFSLQVSSTHYCPHTRELFHSKQILEYLILRRVKYYHILCRKHVNLTCFHDQEVFMCLCTEERHANCFHFDFKMIYNCRGENQCRNNATCYQNHQHCPTMQICVCPQCYYGAKCQFHVKNFGLTLDSIIGYHIYPNIAFSQQSTPVYISTILSILMLVIVFINGTLSIWTFQLKTCRETGCGIYIYASSIMSIITIGFLNFKVFSLVFSQMSTNTPRSFLLFNCIAMDFLLRLSLATSNATLASLTLY